ncbi:hypothetical protein EVAR_74114_1 [Eumeta japonica]|uniref:Reverse transcriptase domain-containing protein n=1 Tax=Eumeta variegata TaxID=151549 RepID=A0A4C1TU47_EUMVA|nr:hypothetical protein EVAR_74114_1 [Eumeta japonica]
MQVKAKEPKMCAVCKIDAHKVNQCEKFKGLQLNQKWDIVKSQHLCRQCLNQHKGRCNKSQLCGVSDEGSSVTLVDESIFEGSPIDGVHESLCLQWTGGTTRMENSSFNTSLTISSANNDKKFLLSNVHTVKQLDLPTQSLNMSEISARYPYLKNLPIQAYKRATPMILIGANNWKLAVPLKVREGGWHQPIATKTRLGWAIQGGKSSSPEQHLLNIHTCICKNRDDELHELVKNYFSMEMPISSTRGSQADADALEILKSSCKQVDKQYEVGLIWKNRNIQLPESYDNVLRRLICLHKKIVKDPSLHQKMQPQIDNLLQKGYATKISPQSSAVETNKLWYLPIFIALNPNKPDKIRLVWDAAAQSNGASLNDFMLSGPDLLTPLIDILLAFRIGKVAICGDIAEMFHRINVRESDMHAQRFLWWDKGDSLYQPSEFIMRAITFGLNCAPCIAHYVRNVNAEKFKEQYPRAVQSILHHHYMDDLIDSEDTEEAAVSLAKQVSEIHDAAGFYIRNWASNSSSVLHQLSGVSEESQHVKQWGTTEKILGMYWNPANDIFEYVCRFVRLHRNVIENDIVPTKRECLQVLMSIFDPLGFLSCHTIGLKILLQDIWRSRIGWDDELNEPLRTKWLQWKSTIPFIKEVKIPRCYSLELCNADKVELHTFVDAGEYAYSAVCYLLVKRKNKIDVNIVVGKAKVAPLRPMSIPRMELQAALIGAKLASKVKQMQRLHINSSYYWSDSKTVLQWLRMDPRNLQHFVMHRVGEILELSSSDDWRWVPSKLNPADFATKTTTERDTVQWS